MSNERMWEILVPTLSNEGNPFRTRFHQVWDSKVRNIVGGLTILKPTMGQWISPRGDFSKERMIPIRIMCSREQIEKIIDITLEYYNQEAILAYCVSNECIIKYASKKDIK